MIGKLAGAAALAYLAFRGRSATPPRPVHDLVEPAPPTPAPTPAPTPPKPTTPKPTSPAPTSTPSWARTRDAVRTWQEEANWFQDFVDAVLLEAGRPGAEFIRSSSRGFGARLAEDGVWGPHSAHALANLGALVRRVSAGGGLGHTEATAAALQQVRVMGTSEYHLRADLVPPGWGAASMRDWRRRVVESVDSLRSAS